MMYWSVGRDMLSSEHILSSSAVNWLVTWTTCHIVSNFTQFCSTWFKYKNQVKMMPTFHRLDCAQSANLCQDIQSQLEWSSGIRIQISTLIKFGCLTDRSQNILDSLSCRYHSFLPSVIQIRHRIKWYHISTKKSSLLTTSVLIW